MKRIPHWILLILTAGLLSCSDRERYPFNQREGEQTGIDFVNQLDQDAGWNVLRYLYYYNGGGVAAADFNNDGWIDLYFTGNQVADRLYLNRGDWRFEDVTTLAGVDNAGNWTTGATQADVNGDGLIDLYVCRVSDAPGGSGRGNLLYINQGVDAKGIPRFKEEARKYGLDFEGYSTHAAFFDKDLDGDLDLYLLNHSIHPNRTYGRGSQREGFHPQFGDVMYENQEGRFVEVSEKAGIFQGKSGYGLGLSLGYLDRDSLPDIYVGNDFYENDYCYIGVDGMRFRELLSSSADHFGHTTHFSMGNTVADFDRDGRFDLLSLDMLPRDRETYMSSGQEYPYSTYRSYLLNGYHPQYMQNTLHLNQGELQFSDAAFLAGIAATDWSWNALTPDLDNDGWKDIFITNGILGATNDMDFINFVSSQEIQRRIETSLEENLDLIAAIPEKKVANRVYRNPGTFPFEDQTGVWIPSAPGFSQGSISADLDNDGDLDLVSSSTNGPVEIWENRLPQRHWVQFSLKGPERNSQGVGALIEVYQGGRVQREAHFPSNAYLSCLPNRIHFGLGDDPSIDSVAVFWPSLGWQVWDSPEPDRLHRLIADPDLVRPQFQRKDHIRIPAYARVDSLLSFVHRDPPTLDFDRSPLIPFSLANEGPDLAVADFDGDGLDDVVVGGAKGQSTLVFTQNAEGTFRARPELMPDSPALHEDVALAAGDFDGDGWMDLLVGSAGNEFASGAAIQPRLYLNRGGVLVREVSAFKGVELQVSDIALVDFDGDGDLDVFVAGLGLPFEFGAGARSYLFENDGRAAFRDVTELRAPALMEPRVITDSHWADIDGNGTPDLLLAAHWEPPAVLWNRGGRLDYAELGPGRDLAGLWNAVTAADLDGDGDLDPAFGNWGLNTKLTASTKEPLTLYRSDFDRNGTVEVLLAQYIEGEPTPVISKEIWSKQLPSINKEYLSYTSFARADLDEVFGSKALRDAQTRRITQLASGWFVNQGGDHFDFHPFASLAQMGTIEALLPWDSDRDGVTELFAGGNRHEVSTQIGRQDALLGLKLVFGPDDFEGKAIPHTGQLGAVRSMRLVRGSGGTILIIGVNNGPIRALKIETEP